MAACLNSWNNENNAKDSTSLDQLLEQKWVKRHGETKVWRTWKTPIKTKQNIKSMFLKINYSRQIPKQSGNRTLNFGRQVSTKMAFALKGSTKPWRPSTSIFTTLGVPGEGITLDLLKVRKKRGKTGRRMSHYPPTPRNHKMVTEPCQQGQSSKISMLTETIHWKIHSIIFT